MLDKLKVIGNHIWNVFLLYVLYVMCVLAVSIGVVAPKIGLTIVFLAVASYVTHIWLNIWFSKKGE